jgi:8-oxo-dGTP pyrophosphatase MutT (NUDIX family)
MNPLPIISDIRVIMLTLDDIAHNINPILKNPQFRTNESGNDASSGDTLSISAAILVIIHCKYATPHMLLTKRSSNLRSHTGEISFPGGRYSSVYDLNLLDTALRETREEVGLYFRAEDILGRLESVHTLTSNFTIVPFITLQTKIPEPKIFTDEVESIIDVPLQETLATCQPDLDHYHISQKDVYKFTHQETVIWGATARVLKQLHNYLTP